MAPKAANDSAAKDNSAKTFSFDDVAYLVAKLEAHKVGLGAKDYQIMSKLNGTRSEHGYNHLFRTVKARGKEILPMITGGATNSITASPSKSPAGGKAKARDKRGRKARSEEREEDDDEETTNKKVKPEQLEGEADAPTVDEESN